MARIGFDFFERRLSAAFCHYASFVSKWPVPFVLIPFVISLSMTFGFLCRMEIIQDDLSLYTPTDGRAKSERAKLELYFTVTEQDPYFFERRFDSRRSGYLIVTSKQFDDNVLTDKIFEDVAALWTSIEQVSVVGDKDDKHFQYADLCIYAQQEMCVFNPLLSLYSLSPKMLSKLTYPTYQFIIPYMPPAIIDIFLGQLLGGVTVNSDRVVISAKAILLPYQLKFSKFSHDELAKKWEVALDALLTDYRSDNISVNWWTSETLTMETAKDTRTLLKLLAPMFVLVTAFTVGCCFVNDMVRSKPLLGLAGVLSAILAIVSAMGFLLLIGAKLTTVSFFVPFITFSVGVDNVFILIAAWRKTNVYGQIDERMVGTFREAAVSITVTSLTDAVSFGVGCMSNFPSVQNFCLYACVSILFVYINQLTFFAGCMILSGIREQQHRNCITFKRVMVKSQTKEANGGIFDHAAARFFKNQYSTFLLHPMTKFFVFISLLLYISVAILGLVNLQIGVHPSDLLPADSKARTSISLVETLFSNYTGTLQLYFVNLSTFDQTSVNFWHTLDDQVKVFENTEYSDTSDSWFRAFVGFLKTSNHSTLAYANFTYLLKDVFLHQDRFRKYSSDVVFLSGYDNVTDILLLEAARFPVRLKRMTFVNQYNIARYFRDLADKSQMNANVYHQLFEFADQFDAILPSILSNMAIGSAAVVITSLLLIPKPLCSLWVCMTIVSINVGIFGYMSLWGVHLDFVSMVTIVMSIGASVDFSAHIAYHFAKDEKKNVQERVRDSLYVVGTPIVQSAVSTLLGIVLVTLVDNYTFRSFVKTTFLVILFGMLHGLIVLPVLLTVFYCEKNSVGKCRGKNSVGAVQKENYPSSIWYSTDELNCTKLSNGNQSPM